MTDSPSEAMTVAQAIQYAANRGIDDAENFVRGIVFNTYGTTGLYTGKPLQILTPEKLDVRIAGGVPVEDWKPGEAMTVVQAIEYAAERGVGDAEHFVRGIVFRTHGTAGFYTGNPLQILTPEKLDFRIAGGAPEEDRKPPVTSRRKVPVYSTDKAHDVGIPLSTNQYVTFEALWRFRAVLPIAELSRARVVFWGHPEWIASEIQSIRTKHRQETGGPRSGFDAVYTNLRWIHAAVTDLIDPDAPQSYKELKQNAETMARVRGAVSATSSIEYTGKDGKLVTSKVTWTRDVDPETCACGFASMDHDEWLDHVRGCKVGES